MGTNYYLKQDVCKHCGRGDGPIHLGKSSAGWNFSFQWNNGQYYKSVPEMKKWLAGKEIYNEYEEKVSKKKFWEMIEEKQKDGLSHGEKYPDHSFVIDGYSFIDSEFS